MSKPQASKNSRKRKQGSGRKTNQSQTPSAANAKTDPAAFPARVIANFGPSAAIVNQAGEIRRAVALKKLDLLVAGDKVSCVAGDKPGETHIRITELHERQSVLARPDRRGQLKPLAANVTRLLIVIAPLPEPESLLIDQFCIAAASAGIEPVIILNKTDQLLSSTGASQEKIQRLLDDYEAAGFETVRCSAKTDPAIENLTRVIGQQTSVLVGQSGVGKSSIVKRLLPDQEVRVGAISAATGVGAHTTTVSFWYELDCGGALIDSPGVRQFSVDYLQPHEVEYGYPEMGRLRDGCRFANCTHSVEPNCAIRSAVDNNTLSKHRYDNFIKLSEQASQA